MRGRREEATSFLRFISRLLFLMRLPRRLMLTLGFCLFVFVLVVLLYSFTCLSKWHWERMKVTRRTSNNPMISNQADRQRTEMNEVTRHWLVSTLGGNHQPSFPASSPTRPPCRREPWERGWVTIEVNRINTTHGIPKKDITYIQWSVGLLQRHSCLSRCKGPWFSWMSQGLEKSVGLIF